MEADAAMRAAVTAERAAEGGEAGSSGAGAGGPPGRRIPGWLAAGSTGLAGLIGLLLYLLPLHGVRLTSINGLGLISVLPAASLAGLALLVLATVAMLAGRRPAPLLLTAMLVAVTFCLDGVTALVEPLPRFATAYQVSGFASYIGATGHVAPGLTAYFSWPGFLALMAFAAKAAGLHSMLPLMRWWPFIADALLLAPYLLLTRALRINWRARWFGALLLCLGNWVGQDYFSPQSANFLLYLVFAAILVTWFNGVRPGARAGAGAARGPGTKVPGELPARQAGAAQRAILLAIVIAIFAVSVISHQLTPFLMLATCAGLVIVGRCTPRGLPILLGVILLAWISYGTVAYWSGHMSTIFGDIGRLGSTFSSSVAGRIVGTAVHQRAVRSRVVLAGLMAGLAVLGLLRRRRRGISDRALAVLLIAPVGLAAVQSYGGEISLRIYLFALPAAATLAASLFFPEPTPAAEPGPAAERAPSARRAAGRPAALPSSRAVAASAVAAGLLAVALAPLFLLARYGNEGFERTPPGELRAMNYIYDHDRGGARVLWISRPAGQNATPQMPWQFRDLAKVRFVSISAPRDPADTAGLASYLRSLGARTYLITTTTEATFIRQTASFPPDWETRFRRALDATPGVRLVLADRTAAVYRARRPAGGAAPAGAHQASRPAAWTIWTPVGLAALGIALITLTAREFIAQCWPARRWLTRPLAIAAVPAVILLAAAVVERFRVLS